MRVALFGQSKSDLVLGAWARQPSETRTCPGCGEDVSSRVMRATYDYTFFGRRPKPCPYPVIVQCPECSRYAEYLPVAFRVEEMAA